MARRRLAIPIALLELIPAGLGKQANTSGDTFEIERHLGKFAVSVDAALTTAVSTAWKRFQGRIEKPGDQKSFDDPSRWKFLRTYSGDNVNAARGTYLQVLRVLGEPLLMKRRVPGVHFGLRKLTQLVTPPSMAMAIALTNLEQQGGEVAFVRLMNDPNHRNVNLILVGAEGHGVGDVEAVAEEARMRGGRAGKVRYVFLLQT